MSNRRELFRVETQLQALRAVELTSPNRRSLDLTVLNLSGGGMLCQVNRPIPWGAIIQVTLGLERSRTLTLKAEVVRLFQERTSDPPTYRLGCRFVYMTVAEQDALVGFVLSQQGVAKRAGLDSTEV